MVQECGHNVGACLWRGHNFSVCIENDIQTELQEALPQPQHKVIIAVVAFQFDCARSAKLDFVRAYVGYKRCHIGENGIESWLGL